MKKIFLSLAMLAFTANVFAQLVLPQPSPKAVVTQTAGLTDITIEYSSPGVKGRPIWGSLVPYDSLWRAGANSATKITFSRDVTIEGTKVEKGSYSIFMLPAKAGDWTIILNKNASASTGSYKQSEDAVRVKAKPQEIPMRERLLYTVSNFNDAGASVDMEWEKVRVSFTVKLDTDKQALDNINNTLGGTWRMYANAARYMLDTKKDYDTGMKYIDQSISLKEDWYNVWIKAQLQSAKGLKADAYKSAQKAKELGDKSSGFFFKDDVEKALKEWPQK
jgi:hypothetical protein